jgi:hypothetical protein
MAEDPRPALTQLRKALGDATEEIGLPLEGFVIIDDPDHGHICQAAFHFDPEIAFATPEQREIDRQFAEMALAEQEEAVKKRVAEVTRQTLEKLDTSDGIGLDDE